MEISGIGLPSAEHCFLIFFAVSFGMLGLIASAGIPALARGCHKHFRQAMARRRRIGRALADPVKLREDSRGLEGVYVFEGAAAVVAED
tara:strand:+ start:2688 stop:2954 length:267 start_codon:yes stop_codon:yes gene_type:complete